MTIREMYDALGSDFDALLGRLMKEELVERLVKKYTADTNMELLEKSLGQKDYEEAFRAVHTLKGLAMNLGFDKLAASASELTEDLRFEKYGRIDELFGKVKADQEEVLSYIARLN